MNSKTYKKMFYICWFCQNIKYPVKYVEKYIYFDWNNVLSVQTQAEDAVVSS